MTLWRLKIFTKVVENFQFSLVVPHLVWLVWAGILSGIIWYHLVSVVVSLGKLVVSVVVSCGITWKFSGTTLVSPLVSTGITLVSPLVSLCFTLVSCWYHVGITLVSCGNLVLSLGNLVVSRGNLVLSLGNLVVSRWYHLVN